MTRSNRQPARAADEFFLETSAERKVGIELASGRAWMSVERPVGHGSENVLFELTAEQYLAELTGQGHYPSLEGAFWRGAHDELILAPPRGRVNPRNWEGLPTRIFPARVAGELWRIIAALGRPADSVAVLNAQRLAAGTAALAVEDGTVRAISVRLNGADAYPRPGAVIAGLDAGNTRAQVGAVLTELDDDAFSIADALVRCEFIDDELVGVTFERPTPPPLPGGTLGTYLTMLGDVEAGPAFQVAVALAGGVARRWAGGIDVAGNRLIELENRGELMIRDGRVDAFRLPQLGHTLGTTDVVSRESVHDELGAPSETRGDTDFYSFATCDVKLTYGLIPGRVAVHAALRGGDARLQINRWRSGELIRYLDVLRRPVADSLAVAVRAAHAVTVRHDGEVVTAIELAGPGAVFDTFIDGMPKDATREDIPLRGAILDTATDSVWEFQDVAYVHVRGRAGAPLVSICVSVAPPDVLSERTR